MLRLKVWLPGKRLAGRRNPERQSVIFDSRYLEAWLPNRRERWMSRAALMTAAMAGWLYLMMVWVLKVGLVRGESCSKASASCSIIL